MATYLVDIDGTIADNAHRQWVLEDKTRPTVNWELFFQLMGDDKPFPHMLQLLTDLTRTKSSAVRIVYVTGRPERWRNLTTRWLVLHRFPYPHSMYMRPDGDHRPDHVVKLELLEQIRKDGIIPVMSFDDRNTVVKMWREAGVPCAQVAEGDF